MHPRFRADPGTPVVRPQIAASMPPLGGASPVWETLSEGFLVSITSSWSGA